MNTILGILLIISLLGNFFLLKYARQIAPLIVASRHTTTLFIKLSAYKDHLAYVYSLPVFHGDATIQGLLKHTKDMLDHVKKYKGINSLTEPDLEEILLSDQFEEYDEDYDEEGNYYKPDSDTAEEEKAPEEEIES